MPFNITHCNLHAIEGFGGKRAVAFWLKIPWVDERSSFVVTTKWLLDKLDELGIRANGNVPVLREQISRYLVDVCNAYKNETNPKKFESIHVVDLQLIYAGCTTDRQIMSIIIQKDGIGLWGDCQPLIHYGNDWKQVSSLCINSNRLYVTHQGGVEQVSSVNFHVERVISAGGEECVRPHTLAPYGVRARPQALLQLTCLDHDQVFQFMRHLGECPAH